MSSAVRSIERTITGNPVLELKWPWSYKQSSEKSRDSRLDLLRGFCLFVMAVDHIGVFGPDTWLYSITGKGEFFISAAEGFVFISGLVMGMVYKRLIFKEGLGKAVPKLLNRVVKLYFLTVGLSLFFTALAAFTPLKLWAERDWISIKDPVELVVGAFTLHYAFHGSSIMVMYVLFIAMAPLIFYLFTQGKTWLVMALSVLVWFGNLFYPGQFSLPFASNFPFAAWQLLFVSAISIGYYRHQLAGFLKPNWRVMYYAVVATSAILLLALFILDRTGWAQKSILNSLNYQQVMENMADKGKLPVERLVGVFLYLQAFYLMATWLWVPLKKAVGWFLIPLGEAGLYVFSLHLALIVLIYNVPGLTSLPYLLYGFAELAVISLLWFAVRKKFLFKLIPN